MQVHSSFFIAKASFVALADMDGLSYGDPFQVGTSIGMHEQQVVVFDDHPDPAAQAVRLTGIPPSPTPVLLTLRDAIGRRVHQQKAVGDNQHLDISGYSDGLDFVELQGSTFKASRQHRSR